MLLVILFWGSILLAWCSPGNVGQHISCWLPAEKWGLPLGAPRALWEAVLGWGQQWAHQLASRDRESVADSWCCLGAPRNVGLPAGRK